jgi:predicted DsbA family dithiol-disulfide isomerase
MARIVIPIYFDYASTLCYIAWRIVDQLEKELGFISLWKGVPIAWPRSIQSRAGKALSPAELNRVLMVAEETGIKVTPPSLWIDSRAALQGSELARESNVFGTYHEMVFRAAFEQRRDIGQMDVLADLAEVAGMDRECFSADIEARRMAGRLAEHKLEADRFSALGYPTFMLGDFPLIGIQPVETMRMLIERFIEQREREPQA